MFESGNNRSLLTSIEKRRQNRVEIPSVFGKKSEKVFLLPKSLSFLQSASGIILPENGVTRVQINFRSELSQVHVSQPLGSTETGLLPQRRVANTRASRYIQSRRSTDFSFDCI